MVAPRLAGEVSPKFHDQLTYGSVPPVALPENATFCPKAGLIGENAKLTVIDGLTVNGSQRLSAPLLFASPLYTALQLTVPAVVKVWDAELGTTLFVTVTGLPTMVPVPEHVEPVKKL